MTLEGGVIDDWIKNGNGRDVVLFVIELVGVGDLSYYVGRWW